MRKLALFFLTIGLFSNVTASVGLAEEAKLVAASYSDRYHLSTCKIVEKIAPQDLKTFKTPEEAVGAGFAPCKKCNPPEPKNYKKPKYNFGSKKDAD